VIDLGSGDGRIVIVAAKTFGAKGLGVEIVPGLVKTSRENAALAGVEARAEFKEQDLFKTDLAKATVVTLYLLPEVNLELRPRLLELKAGTRIVSHDWDMGDWTPDRTLVVDAPDKQIGRDKTSKVHLWIVPARVHGAWCGSGRAKATTLEIEQKFQQFRATITRGTAKQSFDGRIRGSQLQSVDNNWVLTADGSRLRPVVARSAFAEFRGTTFTRRATDSCK